MSTLEKDVLQLWQNEIVSNSCFNIVQNSISNNFIKETIINRNLAQQLGHIYSNVVEPRPKSVTNQKSSGRCWIFAALNMMRLPFMKHYDLTEFEFSQSYVFFYYKLESANYFLNSIVKLKQTGSQFGDVDRVMMHLLETPTQDGGQWDMFVSVVKKYGIVPKLAFQESKHSSNSSEMNSLLNYKLRESACRIWNDFNNASSIIKNSMKEIYKILLICLGTPPVTFDWEYSIKNKITSHINLTPNEFYDNFVKQWCDLDNYISIIHDPRSFNNYNTSYTVEFLGAVVTADDSNNSVIKYLNLSIERIKELAKQSILKNFAVWYGCDVGKNFCKSLSVLDNDINKLNGIFDVDFTKVTKEQKLIWNISKMGHAMLITGVHINKVDNKENIVRWEVENSWGKGQGESAGGYLLMTDEWFDDYAYQVVINKSLLTVDELNNYNQDPLVLPPWDAFGSLAH